MSSQTSAYTLRGTVVNSVTGEAIPGALVQAYLNGQRAILAGSDGKFQFEGVPAGQFNVTAQKPGFFDANSLPSSVPRAPSLFAAGPDAPPAVLKLIPEGLIYGRISGDNGEPIEDFPVRLLFEQVVNGKNTPMGWKNTTTGEDGEFRIPELPPGAYILFAGPSPAAEPVAAKLPPQGYPAVFYPGASDFSSAGKIEITPGKHVEINLTVSPQPFYRVAGTLSGYPPDGQVSLQFFNAAGQSVGVSPGFSPSTGTFRSHPMPAGSYTVTAHAQDNKGLPTLSASRTVNLTSDLSGVHLALVPGATIPVNVRVEKTRSEESNGDAFVGSRLSVGGQPQEIPPARVAISAHYGLDAQMQYGSDFIGNPGNRFMALQNVDPGVYKVQVFPNGMYYVQSAQSGSTDLLRSDLTIPPGGSVPPIDVVLRDDFARVHGNVRGERRSVVAAIMVVPEAPAAENRFFPAYPDGSFDVSYLAPGTYQILAFDSASGLDSADPETLQKYLSHASEITLAPNQALQIDLDLVQPGAQP